MYNKKLKIKLPYNPAIPLLGICPEKTIVQKDMCTPVFIAALFTIARTWKQPKRPSIDEQIKKTWYILTMEYYSAMKRNETGSFVEVWMDLESVIPSKVKSSTSFSFQHTICPTQASLAPSRRRASLLKGLHCSGPPISVPSSTRVPAHILTCSLLSSVHPAEKTSGHFLFIYFLIKNFCFGCTRQPASS